MYNMNTITIYFILAVLYFLGLFVYKIERESILFGVKLPPGYKDRKEFSELKREYRKRLSVGYLPLVLIYIILSLKINSVWAVVLGDTLVFIEMIVVGANYYKINKKIKLLKEAEKWEVITEDTYIDNEDYIMGFIYYSKKNSATYIFNKEEGRLYFNFAKPLVKISALFLIGALIFIFSTTLTFPWIFKDRKVEILDNRITIEGKWGMTLNKEEISKISLERNLPMRIRRSGGKSINKMIMGSYKVFNYKEGHFYIMDRSKNFISITTKDNKIIFINYEDTKETEDLYELLNSKLGT